MSLPNGYVFRSAEQWARCVSSRFDALAAGGMRPSPKLGSRPFQQTPGNAAEVIAIDRCAGAIWRVRQSGVPQLLRRTEPGAVAGPFEITAPLSNGSRWIVDRHWLWSFVGDRAEVARHEPNSLQRDRVVAMPPGHTILDIALDGKGGVWVLLVAPTLARSIQHVDCKGCLAERCVPPCEAGTPVQIASLDSGKRLALLDEGGRSLALLDPRTCKVDRVVTPGGGCWSTSRIASDNRRRLALWGTAGPAASTSQHPAALIVLNVDGDAVDGPLAELFASSVAVHDLAIAGNVVVFATSSGVWRLDATEASVQRPAESVMISPALVSPESDTLRGWLRAELDVDLPPGVTLDAEFVSTNDERIAAQAIRIGNDRSASAAERMQGVWAVVESELTLPAEERARRARRRRFSFAGPHTKGEAVSIPLFDSRDRWLWLRLSIHTPPGTPPPTFRELRVLYPDVSIGRYLPAVFSSDRGDPTGLLRSLVGVLETTTQQLDQRIRSIATHLDPDETSSEWLDYMARWLDLPWDDGLGVDAKRRVLRRAAAIVDGRGTRDGLQELLTALIGEEGSVRLRDLTVDHAPLRLGGADCPGRTLPAVLAGASKRAATLGAKAVLGRACLGVDCHPLTHIVPTIVIEITADARTKVAIGTLLERIVAQYIPAGMVVRVRWRIRGRRRAGIAKDVLVLEGQVPGAVGESLEIGRATLSGRKRRVIEPGGLDLGFQLS